MVIAALDKLFKNTFFEICTIRDINKMLGVSEHTEAFQLLKTLHCMHYADMQPELRERIPHLVREAINPPRQQTRHPATDLVVDGLQVS